MSHSSTVVAVQLVTRICDGFEITFGIQHLLDRPTVRQLASVVEASLLARLDAMSDEEIRERLDWGRRVLE